MTDDTKDCSDQRGGRTDQRRSWLDKITAAYLADLARALKDVVLVEERDGMTTRWWFKPKREWS